MLEIFQYSSWSILFDMDYTVYIDDTESNDEVL